MGWKSTDLSTITRSRDFKPGHPLLFWVAMIVFIFGFFSGAKAWSSVHDCDPVSGGVKHWRLKLKGKEIDLVENPDQQPHPLSAPADANYQFHQIGSQVSTP